MLINGTRIQILLDVKGFVEVSGLSKDDFEKKVAKIQEFKNLSINLKTVANVTSKLNQRLEFIENNLMSSETDL